MTIGASTVLAFLLTAMVGLTGWLFGKAHAHTLKIEELEAKLYRTTKEHEVLLDSISRLSIDNARLSEQINMLEDKLSESESRIATQVAEKVEKRWDAGLEKMMAWNPYDIGNEDGGN